MQWTDGPITEALELRLLGVKEARPIRYVGINKLHDKAMTNNREQHIDLSPQLEAELQSLLAAAEHIRAVERVQKTTGLSQFAAARVVISRIPPRKRSPCPYCGELLRTDVAKQCFICGMDWHDLADVVQHTPRPSE